MWVYISNFRLPSEYQEVEYIQSTGTQWINTWLWVDQNTIMECKVNMQPWATYQFPRVYWVRNWLSWSSERDFWLQWDRDNKFFYAVNYTNYGSTYCIQSGTFADNTDYTIKHTNTQLRVNGVSQWTVSATTYSISYPLWLFNDEQAWSDFDRKAKMKLYRLKMYNWTTLQRDFIPCYRKSDNVIGLYDLVNSVFYTNSWSWTFSKGNDVTMVEMKNAYIGRKILPDEYQEAEYIQSSWTQYINTGCRPSSNIEVECKVNIQSSSFSSNPTLYWARNTDSWASRRAFSLQVEWGVDKYTASIYSNTGTYQVALRSINTVSTNVDYVLKQTHTNFYVDWVSQGTYSCSSYSVWYNMYVFAYNVWWSASQQISMKLYSMKIRDSWTLVRNFVPCYRKSDSVIWLYDLVNDTFYTNSWTWTFTKWPDVN